MANSWTDETVQPFYPFHGGARKHGFTNDSIHEIDTEELDTTYLPANFSHVRAGSGNNNNEVHRISPAGSASSNGRSKPSLFMEPATENGDVLLSGIFEVEGKTFDTTLKRRRLVLQLIGSSKKVPSSMKKKQHKVDGESTEIDLGRMFGVTIKRAKPRRTNSNRPGTCLGIELHSSSEYDGDKLKYDVTLLAHPSEQVCTQWIEKIKPYIGGNRKTPAKLRVYINEYAGSKQARTEYKKILPILLAAEISVHTIDKFTHEIVDDDIKALDFSSVDGLLVLGGDGAVKTIVNAVLRKIQLTNGISLSHGETFIESSLPIGIIPMGYTNHIAHTVHGTSDVITSVLHCVQGHTIMSDVCSVTMGNEQVQFVFNAHYGFGGNLLRFGERYKAAGNAKYHAAIAKGLTKAKLKSYDCEIHYKPVAASHGNPKDGNTCRSGCTVCNIDCVTPRHEGSVYSDSLQDFEPLDSSGNSASMAAMKLEISELEPVSIKGSFMNISVFSTPAFNDLAPLGLSKYTHVGDGCMDIALVEGTDKKNFVRYVKRHGNHKNQFGFPFVKAARVSEVTFHMRIPVGWNYRDKSFNEIEYELNRKKDMKTSADEPIRVIDDNPVTDLHFDSDLDEDDVDDDLATISGSNSFSSRDPSVTESMSSNDLHDSKDASAAGYVHPIHRTTLADQMRQKRNEKDMKKEQKAKAKEEMSVKSVWNLDNTVYTETDLSFRCHQKLVMFYGCLMSANKECDDVTCFSAL